MHPSPANEAEEWGDKPLTVAHFHTLMMQRAARQPAVEDTQRVASHPIGIDWCEGDVGGGALCNVPASAETRTLVFQRLRE